MANQPKLKAFMCNWAGQFQRMCGDTSALTASRRMNCLRVQVFRMNRDEQNPDSAAVRLAIAYPATVWRRNSRPLGNGWDCWFPEGGDENPVLPEVWMRAIAIRTELAIPLDYTTIYGGDRDELKTERYLEDLMRELLEKAGAVRYELFVIPPEPGG